MPQIDKSPLNYRPNKASSIRRFSYSRPPTVNDYKNFKIGDEWLDNSSDDWYKLSSKTVSSGLWVLLGGTGGPLETLTGNAGGAVHPDAVNNITFIGSGDITVTGNPATNTLTISDTSPIDVETFTGDIGGAVSPDATNNITLDGNTNGMQITGIPATNTLTFQDLRNTTEYVVDATAGATEYQTIQSALDAANTAGGNALVYIRPGTYTEDLVLYDGIFLKGDIGPLGTTSGTRIIGTHTPPASGSFSINGITLVSATDVFNSAVAGSTHIYINGCIFEITNGFIFNLPNWTGLFNLNDCGENSTNNGIANNSAGADFFTNNSQIGAGIGQTFVANGDLRFDLTFLDCPCNFSGAGVFSGNFIITGHPVTIGGTKTGTLGLGSLIFNTITTADTLSLVITDATFDVGANQAITHNSASTLTLADVNIDSSNNPSIGGTGTILFGSVTFLDDSDIAATITQTLTPILKTGEIHAENVQNMDCSGIEAWSGAGAYYSLAATDFTLLRGGSGYIRGKLISWAGTQSTGALAVGSTYYIYVDEDGIIGTTTTRTYALFRDNIVFFEVLVDPNSVVTVVREDHPYNFSTAVSEWAHDIIGTVIGNKNNGANIVLNGTKAIQINGADLLEDHGLETVIPDSGGAAVNFTFMFVNVAGKWEIDSVANTFASEYNNAGTVTALGANKYGIFRLYVSKDDLNTSTPVYYAVLDDAQYNNLTQAQTAVTNNTVSTPTNELAQLEVAQLGFVIKAQATDTIVDVIIEKDVGSGSTSLITPGVASLVSTNVTNFDGWLSAADTTVQAALETLDDQGKNVTPEHAVLVAGAGYDINSIAIGATGELLVGTGVDPAFGNTSYGDFSFTNLGAATPRSLSVINTDTNIASIADLRISIPPLGADGMVSWEVQATLFYSLGIDNSDSDILKLTNSSDPSGGTVLFQATNTGLCSFLTNNVDITRNTAGAATVSLTTANTDNTAVASNAANIISVGGTTSTGDPYTQWLITGSTTWNAGIDNSDADAFKIGPNADPSTGNSDFEIATTGAITFNEAYTFPTADGAANTVLTTNGSGTVTWSTTSGFVWNDVTVVGPTTMVANQGYVANNAGLVTLALPAVAAFGATFQIVGLGAGGWLISQNAGQVINFNSSATTVGVGGSLASTNRYNCVEIICVVANTTFVVMDASGNLTVT